MGDIMNAAQTTPIENVECCSTEESVECRINEAKAIVKKNMLWSMGLSVVPIPAVDLIGVTAFQVKALNELSNLYELPFSEHKIKNVVATLLSGLGTVYLGQALALSMFKVVPVLGPLAAMTATPLMAGAMTYALGKVFIQHFESGGTFLDFDPKAVRSYFREQFSEGLKVAAEMHKSKTETSGEAPKSEVKTAASGEASKHESKPEGSGDSSKKSGGSRT